MSGVSNATLRAVSEEARQASAQARALKVDAEKAMKALADDAMGAVQALGDDLELAKSSASMKLAALEALDNRAWAGLRRQQRLIDRLIWVVIAEAVAIVAVWFAR